MGIYIKLAWRNLFRNKRRTFIAGTAIGIGLAALIYVDAMVIGMENNMIASATSSLLGEGQIHREGYRETHEVELTIQNLDRVIDSLKQQSILEHFSMRVMSFGMITSPANVCAVSMIGINPQTERYLSQIDDALSEGTYFEQENDRDIIIGSKLAKLLEVGVGDRVVMTVAQAETGDLSQEMFRISGIYYFNVNELDQGMAFVRLHKAQEMLGIGSEVHEIALKFVATSYGQDKEHPFWKKFTQGGNEAVSWTVLLPQMEAVFELTKFSTLMTGIILFSVVALGILNTLFMSLHERMFEFGVLRAVGTRPLAMGRLILFEAGALAAVSIILGIVIGFLITYISTKTGIDYQGIEFAGVTFRNLLYPVMRLDQFIIFPFWVFLFTILIGLYPALYAAKLTPAKAMRRSF